MTAELTAADPALVGNAALLAAVFAGTGDCIKILDLDGNLQFMSEGGKRVMEVDDFAQLKGCPWPDLWADDGQVAARNAVESARNGTMARFSGPANTAKGHARHWDVQVLPIPGPDGRPTHLLSISRDVTELMEAEERSRLLSGELQHRIKNIIAMVSAIASQTLKGEDIAARRETFTARLIVLSHAHDMLVASAWSAAPIRAVVEGALLGHRPETARFTVSGPELVLSPKQAVSLALTIHELATNATKYGALSVDDGHVRIDWSVRDDDGGGAAEFHFVWEESNGPEVLEPDRKGFGTRLITRSLAADFSGTVSITYPSSGVICRMVSEAERLGL